MNAIPEPTATPADGVLVVSAWAGGVADGLLARCTMSSAANREPVTEVVSSVAELHALVDSWVESFTN